MLLTVTSVEKSYGEVAVLNGVSLSLDAGETLALTGESGSGKSTLLHLIGGLDTPDHGKILLEDQDITGLKDPARAEIRRHKVGLVFQQFNLIPSLTLAANLAFQARLAGQADTGWLEHLTERLGLADLNHRYPEQLSGGQQQRVAIGRALAGRPPLLLADEPTGNLDEDTSEAVFQLLLELVRETNVGLLLVTHSTDLAGRLDRHLHLTHGQVA